MKIIDLSIITNNYKTHGNINTYAVLKSNAYGLGLIEICNHLIKIGVTKFCVTSLEDAKKIRSINKDVYILILGTKYDLKLALNDENLSFSVSNLNNIPPLGQVEIKLNYDLNRYGINISDLDYCISKLNNHKIKGVYTHISDFNNIDSIYSIKNILKENSIPFHYISSRFKGVKNSNEYNRLGMSLYRNSMRIIEYITKINYCKKNSYIGYSDYKLKKDSYIAVIDIGYNEGLSRSNIGRKVYINNNYYKIVSICMNNTMILIDNSILLGDEVEILGPNIPIEYISKKTKMKEYEIFVSFRNMKKIYKNVI